MTQLFGIKGPASGEFREKGSKFFSFAYPVTHLSQIQDHLQALQKQFHDARHHCYAYRLGEKGEEVYATDDREPAHSAGPPILAAIKGKEITFVAVFVVRYFGGTKLGIRGLIEAYRRAAEEALAGAELYPIIPVKRFEIVYTYEQTALISKILHPFQTQLLDQSFTDVCRQQFEVPEQEFEGLRNTFVQSGFHIKEL